jgi:elongation factor G
VQGTEPGDAGEQVIYAVVPESELSRYAIELRSLTGGRGRFVAEHDHYDVMPSNLVEGIRRDVREID